MHFGGGGVGLGIRLIQQVDVELHGSIVVSGASLSETSDSAIIHHSERCDLALSYQDIWCM